MIWNVLDRAAVRIVVANGGVRSAPYTVQLTKSAPGVFTYNGGWATATNHFGELTSPSTPAVRSKQLTIYMTGQGEVAPSLRTGRAATDRPLIFAPARTRVFIGGVEAKVLFVGLTPGLVGVLQVNVEPHYLTPTGTQPLIVNLNGFESNATQVEMR